MTDMVEDDLFMRENALWFPGMTIEDYDQVLRALGKRKDNICMDVRTGKTEIRPRNERTREYIFDLLGIDT